MPTADSVRPRLEAVLRQLRDGSSAKWSASELRRWSVVFPQMCEWLPEDERLVMRGEFQRLITEIGAVAKKGELGAAKIE